MTVDAHPLRTTLWHGTRYILDHDGITDGFHAWEPPHNIHLEAARAIAEMPDTDINQLPADQQIALGQLHALIALAQQPQQPTWTALDDEDEVLADTLATDRQHMRTRVGRYLAAARHARGLTQTEAAQALTQAGFPTTQKRLSYAETGALPVPAEQFILLRALYQQPQHWTPRRTETAA